MQKIIQDRNDLSKLKEEKIRHKAECPPGTKKMLAEDRKKLIEGMKYKLKETLQDYAKCPIAPQSISAKNKKIDIEKRMEKLETDLHLFNNKKTIFIEDDE